jgi:hypothetical protein
VSKVGLKLVRSPSALTTSGNAREVVRSAGTTISGAKGSDAATAQGASVPSSGPKGMPAADVVVELPLDPSFACAASRSRGRARP